MSSRINSKLVVFPQIALVFLILTAVFTSQINAQSSSPSAPEDTPTATAGPITTATSTPTATPSAGTTCSLYTSTDVPLEIPLDEFKSEASSFLNVPDPGLITDVNVINLKGTHTWVKDLNFNLQSPQGPEVQILNLDVCGDNQKDFDLNLDDSASANAPCPPVGGGTYKPTNPLSTFNGQEQSGIWILRVEDTFSPEDKGSLDSWGLYICRDTNTPTATATPTITATATASLTPTPTASAAVTSTPTTTATTSPTPSPTATTNPETVDQLYMPIVFTPPLGFMIPPERISSNEPVDFTAARTDAKSEGLDIQLNKIGFHVGLFGNRQGLDTWMEDLDAAGVPIFLKTANDAEPIYEAQQLMQASGVPHILVYRDARSQYDIPRYDLPAQQAAEISWALNKGIFPPELDPALVWMETTNEPDKNKSAWLAEFALATAQMAVADGYKYAAFGWASGEPEPIDWESPEMLAFLTYAGNHPDNVAVALHEYSYKTDYISNIYPWLVGRFQKLFAVCDKHGIKRPTILITEWGWKYDKVPTPAEAMEDIAWASWLYAAYPEVKGAGIWYLGEGDQFGDIHNQAQKLIAPVRDYSLHNYYKIHPGTFPINESLFVPNPPTSIER